MLFTLSVRHTLRTNLHITASCQLVEEEEEEEEMGREVEEVEEEVEEVEREKEEVEVEVGRE